MDKELLPEDDWKQENEDIFKKIHGTLMLYGSETPRREVARAVMAKLGYPDPYYLKAFGEAENEVTG